MYVSVQREDNPQELRRLFVLGVVFVSAMAALIWLSIAIYQKAFTTFTTVTVMADRAGEQLPKFGDVRYNGVLVGQVRNVSQEGDLAVIELGLNPDDAALIPSDFDVSILPTTLFGQKFVSLSALDPDGDLGIEDGTVVPTERVYTSVELSQVLNRLFPVLEAVRPVDLNATLTALATALDGRGEALGASFDKLDGYLADFNRELPTLQEDLRLLASVAQTYDLAAEDLVATLGNLTVTSRTIQEKEGDLTRLFGDLSGVADVSSELLEDNEQNIVRATALSRPIVQLLNKYSPQHYCLLAGSARFKGVLLETFAGGMVRQFIEVPSPQPRGYDQRDLPVYADRSGPRCFGMPFNPPIPWPGFDYDNGTDLDSPEGRSNGFVPAFRSDQSAMFAGVFGGATEQSAMDVTATPDGRRATAADLSRRSGQPVESVTPLAALLYAPLGEGGES